MRKFTYITCPICGKEFQSLGYASHRAMHRRERERAKKLQQPPVINQVCDCEKHLTQFPDGRWRCTVCWEWWYH
jgi:hypothetical protein